GFVRWTRLSKRYLTLNATRRFVTENAPGGSFSPKAAKPSGASQHLLIRSLFISATPSLLGEWVFLSVSMTAPQPLRCLINADLFFPKKVWRRWTDRSILVAANAGGVCWSRVLSSSPTTSVTTTFRTTRICLRPTG